MNQLFRINKNANKTFFSLYAFILLIPIFYILILATEKTYATPPYSQTEKKVEDSENFSKEYVNKPTIYLYFADKDNNSLIPEKRDIDQFEDIVLFAKAIIENLKKGSSKGYVSTIPEKVKIDAIYVTNHKIAYIDFNKSIKEQHPGGIQSELLTIYSIVNSLVLNTSKIKKVKFLIEGHEELTLAGHISLMNPFGANLLLTKQGF